MIGRFRSAIYVATIIVAVNIRSYYPGLAARLRFGEGAGYTTAHERQRFRPFQAGDRPVQLAHHGRGDRRRAVPGAGGGTGGGGGRGGGVALWFHGADRP